MAAVRSALGSPGVGGVRSGSATSVSSNSKSICADALSGMTQATAAKTQGWKSPVTLMRLLLMNMDSLAAAAAGGPCIRKTLKNPALARSARPIIRRCAS